MFPKPSSRVTIQLRNKIKKHLFSYLKFFASGYLKRTKPEIVAITGSVGKTSAKEAIFEVLKVMFGDEVRKSAGNLNNETGVPLAILGYQNSPHNLLEWLRICFSAPFRYLFLKKVKVIILELAADKPGDIEYLTTFIKPKIAVLTGIGPSHLENYGEIEKIVTEKTNLFKAVKEKGFVVVNTDNDLARKVLEKDDFKSIYKTSYAIDHVADVIAKNIKTKIENYEGLTTFEIDADNKSIKVQQKTLGTIANVSSALAGATVGLIYNMKLDEIAKGLSEIQNEKHRMQVSWGKNDTTIIDDSYNASPASMEAALKTLESLVNNSSDGRKIAILGDMREIGSVSDAEHVRIGKMANEVADVVLSVGTEAKKYNGDHHFNSVGELIDFALNKALPNDIILIKASRSIGLDEVAEALSK